MRARHAFCGRRCLTEEFPVFAGAEYFGGIEVCLLLAVCLLSGICLLLTQDLVAEVDWRALEGLEDIDNNRTSTQDGLCITGKLFCAEVFKNILCRLREFVLSHDQTTITLPSFVSCIRHTEVE